MRGLRITPNGLDSIDIETHEMELKIEVQEGGVVKITYQHNYKDQWCENEADLEIEHDNYSKITKIPDGHIIWIVPRKK